LFAYFVFILAVLFYFFLGYHVMVIGE